MELLAKLQGEDPFFMAPLIPEHMGTLSKPIMVKSLVSNGFAKRDRNSGVDFDYAGLVPHCRLHWFPYRLVSTLTQRFVTASNLMEPGMTLCKPTSLRFESLLTQAA